MGTRGTYPHSALQIAVLHSEKTRETIAREAGVSVRSLARWLSGRSPPSLDDWNKVIAVCGISPVTCLILASSSSDPCVRIPSVKYFDRFLATLIEVAGEVEGLKEITLDPRAARHDARLVKNSWTEVHRRNLLSEDERYNEFGVR